MISSFFHRIYSFNLCYFLLAIVIISNFKFLLQGNFAIFDEITLFQKTLVIRKKMDDRIYEKFYRQLVSQLKRAADNYLGTEDIFR